MSLFCGNTSHNANSRDVERRIMKFGYCLVDVKCGFAFIEFEDDRDAEDAMKDLRVQDLNGMRIDVEWSRRHLVRRGMYAGRRHDYGSRYDRECCRARVFTLLYSYLLVSFARCARNVIDTVNLRPPSLVFL